VAAGPQERRVNVTYSLPSDQFPQGAVVAIIVQDELRNNTLFEGPVEAGYVFPPTEVIVQGSAILRVVVNGQTVIESPL
jgi:eukaryotic-like serine/threonine-protein kinase